MKFFTDAVVAIAMTLLILPLMESVAEAGRDGVTTADYLSEHGGQLFSFALSFVIIASFWAGHHSLVEHVERDYPPSQGDLTAAIVLPLLFGVALVLALVVPGAGDYPMFVLFLTGPLQALLSRRPRRGGKAKRADG
jgi:hypothetical protein